MIMSSFLMNPGPYSEPKFPPTDEYSHTSYLPTQATDYYRHNVSHYGYGTEYQRRYEMEEKYSPNTQPHYNSCGGSSDNTLKQLPQPNAGQSAGKTSTPSPPIAHEKGQNTNKRVNGYHSQNGPTSPDDSAPSPGSVSSAESEESQSSSCAQQQNGQPIIYPWMRKSQNSNNPGTYFIQC